MKKITFILPIAICLLATNSHANFSTNARSVFLTDYDSGAEIASKNADELMPPSSMIKLMTLTILFDAVQSGDLKMTDTLPVSENADYKNPALFTASKICLSAGQKISVRDTIMGLVVLSGGDAATVVAEKLGGNEHLFATKMQARARSIGMPKSTFANASGLPDPNNLMTSRELATLGTHIISSYPEFYPMFASRRFEFGDYKSDWCRDWGRTHTVNYNRLLFIMPGADGLKTGHTKEGGFGMVASASRGGRRLVGVINGFNGKNHDALAAEMKKLLSYGFANTSTKVYYKAGDTILDIPVWYGKQNTVPATVKKSFAITIENGRNLTGMRILAHFDEPVAAPIAAGQKIGEIIAELDGKIIAKSDLIAKKRVRKTQLFGRVFKNLSVIFTGK